MRLAEHCRWRLKKVNWCESCPTPLDGRYSLQMCHITRFYPTIYHGTRRRFSRQFRRMYLFQLNHVQILCSSPLGFVSYSLRYRYSNLRAPHWMGRWNGIPCPWCCLHLGYREGRCWASQNPLPQCSWWRWQLFLLFSSHNDNSL